MTVHAITSSTKEEIKVGKFAFFCEVHQLFKTRNILDITYLVNWSKLLQIYNSRNIKKKKKIAMRQVGQALLTCRYMYV